MLELIINYSKKFYKWSDVYINAVVEEYERFLYIKSLNLQTLPSDPIAKFWNAHILHTENYYNYCIKKFAKFIHHTPDLVLDQKVKLSYCIQTLKLYLQIYPSVLNPQIWNINTELVEVELDTCVEQNDKITIKIISNDVDKLITVSITPNMTYRDLINFISKKMSYPSSSIRCCPTNKKFTQVYKSIDIDTNININLSKYYIFELE